MKTTPHFPKKQRTLSILLKILFQALHDINGKVDHTKSCRGQECVIVYQVGSSNNVRDSSTKALSKSSKQRGSPKQRRSPSHSNQLTSYTHNHNIAKQNKVQKQLSVTFIQGQLQGKTVSFFLNSYRLFKRPRAVKQMRCQLCLRKAH